MTSLTRSPMFHDNLEMLLAHRTAIDPLGRLPNDFTQLRTNGRVTTVVPLFEIIALDDVASLYSVKSPSLIPHSTPARTSFTS